VEEARDRDNVFAVELLGVRLLGATHWVRKQRELQSIPLGCFGASTGASTGAAAALIAASRLPSEVSAVVSRGGRPDLAGSALREVKSPTLLISEVTTVWCCV
jgi:putative phosphoribosyl transferase